MSEHPTCIFCQRTDSPPSKEDVLPKWLAREWPQRRKSTFEYAGDTYKPGRLSASQPFEPEDYKTNIGNLGVFTYGPCQRCNNGWMSLLEEQTRPVIRPLMRGKPVSMTVEKQRQLAQWTAKTVLLYDYAKRPKTPYFNQEERTGIYTSLAVPPNTIIYAARYVGPLATACVGGPIRLQVDPAGTTTDGYCCTLAIGQLALQLFTYRYSEQVPHVPRGSWELAHRPVSARTEWMWPPQQALDAPGFEEFATRMIVGYSSKKGSATGSATAFPNARSAKTLGTTWACPGSVDGYGLGSQALCCSCLLS